MNNQEQEAEEFILSLYVRTGKDSDEGHKLSGYLEHVVPEWNTSMSPSYLYKYIQKMLVNAEEIRKFEIDLTWKRSAYFVSLLLIFSTAFGGFFLNENKLNDATKIENFSQIILLMLAFFNAGLFFLLSKINLESRMWQNNWENHVDYLQEILGFRMMRICLRPKIGYLTIGKINILISFIIAILWFVIGAVIYVWVNDFVIFKDTYSAFKNARGWEQIASSLHMIFMCVGFAHLSYYCLVGEVFFEEKTSIKGSSKFYIRGVKGFKWEEIKNISTTDFIFRWFFWAFSVFFMIYSLPDIIEAPIPLLFGILFLLIIAVLFFLKGKRESKGEIWNKYLFFIFYFVGLAAINFNSIIQILPNVNLVQILLPVNLLDRAPTFIRLISESDIKVLPLFMLFAGFYGVVIGLFFSIKIRLRRKLEIQLLNQYIGENKKDAPSKARGSKSKAKAKNRKPRKPKPKNN